MLELARSTGDVVTVGTDGSVRARRTTGRRVGHFATSLQADTLEQLRADVDAASDVAPPREEPWHSGAVTESLTVNEQVVIEIDQHDDPPDPWKAAVVSARRLLDDVVDAPEAALELELSGTPVEATLRHVGSEPLTADLEGAAVEAHLAAADGATLGSWSGSVPGGADLAGSVPVGWAATLGLVEAGFEPADGQTVEVGVTLGLPDPLPYTAELWTSGP